MLKINTSAVALGAAMPYKSSMIDWLYVNDKYTHWEFVSALLNDVDANNVALVGCDETVVGSTHTINSGFIYRANEIFEVGGDAITLPPGEVVVCNIIDNYPSPNDPVTFSDGSSHNVHQVRAISFSAGLSGSGDFDYNDLVFLQNPTRQVGSIATVQWEDGSGGTDFKYYKVPFNKLVIDTTLEKISSGSATIITLPSGYRPAQDRYFTSFGGSVNGSTVLTFKIDTAGNVTLWNTNGTLGLNSGDVYAIYAEIPLY